MILKIMAGWTLLLTLIILLARHRWHDDTSAKANAPPPSANEVNQLDFERLQNVAPRCAETLQNYLASATLEEKNQFVLNPAETTSKMVRFYAANPLERVDPAELKLAEKHLLKPPGGDLVETLWSTRDSRKIEAVFREEGDSWKLDWNQFARHSDQPWALFLAGSGDSEGEFRLLARERLAKERKDAKDISLILYAPRFGDPGETGYQSPEFNIDRDSRDGRLVDAAFQMKREGKSPLNSKLAKYDPEEMIRVRVRVLRSEANGIRKFTVTRVIACHWYDIEDPGVEPVEAEPPVEKRKPE